jgi:tRNA U34 5-carboxymethylaminomethyl modifying GTPase MnmE/TrmE
MDIEVALSAIAEADGRSVSEDIVNEIFSHFCVGK